MRWVSFERNGKTTQGALKGDAVRMIGEVPEHHELPAGELLPRIRCIRGRRFRETSFTTPKPPPGQVRDTAMTLSNVHSWHLFSTPRHNSHSAGGLKWMIRTTRCRR
jgi:hypothetical protein